MPPPSPRSIATQPTSSRRLIPLRAAFIPLISALFPAPAQSQAQPESRYETFDQALNHLESADTTAAIELLREVVRLRADHGLAHLRLGALLSAQASELESEFQQRVEAKRLLDRAYRLLGPEPEVLLEYALLLRKMSVRVDAKRILERGWYAAEEVGDSLPSDLRARLHFELGRIFEEWWEDWHGLVAAPFGGASLGCFGMEAVRCPEAWAEEYEYLQSIEGLKAEDRERMVAHYLLALEANPAHTEAAVRLLGHLADAEAWELYDRVAEEHVSHAPEEPRAHLLRGLGFHRRGHVPEAQRAFERALELMEPQERRPFDDLSLLLPRAVRGRYIAEDSAGQERVRRIWFAGKDPLFLTAANERQLEHYARVTWADLKFSDRAGGDRGWESEPGLIWIRYGQPWRWYRCCYGSGRSAYWSYGPDGPLFTFEGGALAYRRLILSEPAAMLAEDLAATVPEAYSPRAVTAVHGIPHQLARFRGGDPTHTRVEIYAAPPVDSLFAAPSARIEAGLFTFLEDYTPVWEGRTLADVSPAGVTLTFRIEVPAGSYRYGLEARLEAPESIPRPLARERRRFEAVGYPAGDLRLSDLLLAADTIRPIVAGASKRDQLIIAPLRGTAVRQGDPFHLYFEVYGLSADSSRAGAYRAELAVEDSTRTNFADRVLRAGQELLGSRGPGIELSWERRVAAVDPVPEFLTVEVPALEPGEYVLRLSVRDLLSGGSATQTRRVRVLP